MPVVRCSCPLLMATVTSEKDGQVKVSRMPLDPQPNPLGNVAAYKDASGRIQARVLKKGEVPASHERVYMPHFATCPVLRQQQERAKALREAAVDPVVVPFRRRR